MIRFIYETFHRLINELSITHTRYLYPSFNINNRLTGLIGARGVGKTTLLLQYIKNNLHASEKAFYFSADLFTHQNVLSSIPQVLPLFKQYLEHGYYPFVFEDVHSYYEKLTRIIDKSIYEDIANFYQLKAQNLYQFKRLLTYLGSIPPGEINVHNIGNNLGIDDKTAEYYLTILNSAGLVRFLYPYGGGSKTLRKPQKIFLNNTTLMHALRQYHGHEINKVTERELFFVQAMQDAGQQIYFSNTGDFCTEKVVFEIGGKSKGRKQLREAKDPSYVVKDDILIPFEGEIPLFYFGFLY